MANLDTYNQSPFNKSRKDKFLLVLNLPEALKKLAKSNYSRSNETIVKNTLEFSVYGTVVPEITIPSVDLRYSGQPVTLSSKARPPYQPVTVSFTVDNRFNNYWTIYKWLNILNDSETGEYDKDNLTKSTADKKLLSLRDIGANLEYATNISLFALDEYDKRIVEFRYKNAFPISLGSIQFNYRDAGEIETEFTFGFTQLIVSLVENVDSL